MPAHDHRTDTELVMAHRQGDANAREVLILRYSGLARAIARRFARRGLAYDDIVQSGYLGLIQAVDRYDTSRGVPLQAYAARTIEGEIMRLRFVHEMTQSEIAEQVGVSQMHVSRLLRSALATLRDVVEEESQPVAAAS